jgi:hypothetical protein
MANITRRVLKSNRTYPGSNSALFLTRWLNAESDTSLGRNSNASRHRVLDFVDNIRDVLQAIKSDPLPYDLGSMPQQTERLVDELNARLEEYPTTNLFLLDCDGSWEFEDGAVYGSHPAGESVAIYHAVQLAKQHLLNRLNQCECGRWFFAKFAHQHFCTARCRKKHHESSEAFKATRREYMRRYYRLKVSGKVK